MTGTALPSRPPDGLRAGATWVAATGAFLLLASATVFVAVRWDELPEASKLALVGALTGSFLLGGRALRRSLPATGDVLFHLGALLVPVDVAALSLRLHLGWRSLLLAEGLVGVVVLGALATAAGSVVLTTAAGAAVVVLAAGMAAVSPLPAPLVLAGAAAGAALAGRHRAAVAWAAVAGLAPVLGAAASGVLRLTSGTVSHSVLEELGLGGRAAALVAVVSSVVAAAVLGREAARRHDLALVALAGACLASGAGLTWVNAQPSRHVTFVALPALFLLIELMTTLVRHDAFFGRPATMTALAAETAAVVGGAPLAGALLLVAPLVERGLDLGGDGAGWRPEPTAAAAWALLAGGWLLAAWRRLDADGTARPRAGRLSPLAALGAAVADDRTVVFLASAAGAAVVVGSASTIAIGAALVVLAAGLAASRGICATLLAVTAAMWAPLVVGLSHPTASVPLGLAAAGVLGLAAVTWRGTAGGWVTSGLGLAGGSVAFGSCLLARGEIGLRPAMLVAVAAAWALGALVERGSPLAGHLVRGTMALGVAGSFGGSAAEVVAVAAAATALFLLDAVRHDEPLVALGASLGLQVALGAAALAAGLGLAATGLVLCIGAVVLCGLAALYPAPWRLPLVASAAVGLLVGLPLASADGSRLAEALVLAGGLAVAAGLILRNGVVGHGGGGLVVLGLVLHLALDHVTALDAFAGPVALQLLIAGWQLRRGDDPPSSWVAYGPSIGLLGGAAVAERLSSGSPWHGLVAGGLGVAAVAVGGWRRLAAPLLLGTGLVVTATVLESVATLAGVPTWAWLAVGGTTLLTTGVALERSATTPVEAGRRLVDVVEERFS